MHIITATYSGDALHAPATATVDIEVLPQIATTTTLATPATRISFGAPVALTATVSPQNATGTVTFFDSSQSLSQLPLSNSAVIFTDQSLAIGIHTLTTNYNGDAADVASASPQLLIEVEPTPTTLTLAPLPATAIYAPSTTLSAGITPASATGTVTFFDNAISLGSPSLVSGTAAIATTLAVGPHTLFAQYSGGPNDLPTSSAPQTITIQPIATTTTLASLPATTAYGSLLTITASISPSSATGVVDFIDNTSGSIAQATLNNGAANTSINTLTLGTHSLTAFYAGDTTHAQSSSQPATTQIVPAPTTTTLAALPATIHAGTPVILSAQIAPASATGTVLFRDTSADTLGQAPVVRGTATLTLNSLAAASYNITAQYSGDTFNAPSTSAAQATLIFVAPTTITLIQPATAAYATPVTLTANVTPATATGTMQFSHTSGLIATALISNGSATAQLSTLTTGTHTLHATYSGDTVNAASTSSTGTTIITADSTTTTLTLAQTNVPAGGIVTFNVAVTNIFGANPTGAIVIRSGSTTLAQAQLSNASNGTAYATLSINAAALGATTVAASYMGDTNNQPSSSIPATYTVIATPTVATLTLSSTPVPLQTPVTLTAIVASTNAVPTGSVVFASNGTTFATVPLNSAGQASTIIASPQLGSHAITATFVPTGLFAASATETQTLTVTLPVALTVSPTTLSATPGSSQSATLTITPLSNFSGAIAAQCISPVPWLTCDITAPASVSATPITATVHIALKTSTAAMLFPFLTLLAFNRRRRRLLPILLAAAMLTATACATGGNFFDLPNGPQQITLAVTAAGVTVTTPLTVNISQ